MKRFGFILFVLAFLVFAIGSNFEALSSLPSPTSPTAVLPISAATAHVLQPSAFIESLEGVESNEDENQSEEDWDQPQSLEDSENLSSKKLLVFDLTDCVRMAIRNNPELEASDYDIRESKALLREANPIGFPIINYEYLLAPAPTDAKDVVDNFLNGDITMFNRFKVELGVPLFTFGKVKFAKKLATEGVLASYERKGQKSLEITLKVKQLYYGLLFAQDLQKMLRDAMVDIDNELASREQTETQASTETKTDTVESRRGLESIGVLSDPFEKNQIKLARFEILKQLGEVEKKLILVRHGLQIQMGFVEPLRFVLKDSHLEPVPFRLKDFNFYLAEAKRYRPESKLLDIALRAKEYEYRLEKRKLLPNVGVGGFFEIGRTTDEVKNLGSVNDFDDPFNFTRAGAGIRVSGELNFKQATARIQQKEAQYYKMSATKDYAEEALSLDLKETYLSVKQAWKDLQEADQAQKIARQQVFMSQSNAALGIGETRDYAEALKNFLITKARYYEAIFQYNVSVAILMSKIGYQVAQ